MSERLLELERAVTTDPLEGSSDGDKPEDAPVSRRTSSTGLVRKSSLTIRRTLSSFRCAAPPCTCLCMPGALAVKGITDQVSTVFLQMSTLRYL